MPAKLTILDDLGEGALLLPVYGDRVAVITERPREALATVARW